MAGHYLRIKMQFEIILLKLGNVILTSNCWFDGSAHGQREATYMVKGMEYSGCLEHWNIPDAEHCLSRYKGEGL